MFNKDNNKYTRISKYDRTYIAQYLRRGKSYSWIARELGVHRSTILREVKRNSINGKYKAIKAHNKAKNRLKDKQKSKRKIDNNQKLMEYIESKLRYKHNPQTPEQISGRLKLLFKENNKEILSFIKNTDDIPGTLAIYRWIKLRRKELKNNLVHKGISYRYKRNKLSYKRKKIIDERPTIIDKKLRLGDFEGDTIEGKNKKQRILTQVDRFSKYILADKVIYNSYEVAKKTIELFDKLENKKSITFDNGSEFESWSLLKIYTSNATKIIWINTPYFYICKNKEYFIFYFLVFYFLFQFKEQPYEWWEARRHS